MKLLKLLEIDPQNLIQITQPTRFQNVIFPDESFYLNEEGDACFTAEYVETIEKVRHFAQKNFQPLNQKKFYFYHGHTQILELTQLGEERLAEYFRSKGYEIIRPETLPLEEQLNILGNCKNFASTLGSCSHNSIFLPDDSEVILIPRFINKNLNAYQAALNQIHRQNTYYVDSTLSLYSQKHLGPFCYILSKQLRKFFNDPQSYDAADFEIFLAYNKHSLSRNLPMVPEAAQYYSKVMPEFIAQIKANQPLCAKYGVNF